MNQDTNSSFIRNNSTQSDFEDYTNDENSHRTSVEPSHTQPELTSTPYQPHHVSTRGNKTHNQTQQSWSSHESSFSSPTSPSNSSTSSSRLIDTYPDTTTIGLSLSSGGLSLNSNLNSELDELDDDISFYQHHQHPDFGIGDALLDHASYYDTGLLSSILSDGDDAVDVGGAMYEMSERNLLEIPSEEIPFGSRVKETNRVYGSHPYSPSHSASLSRSTNSESFDDYANTHHTNGPLHDLNDFDEHLSRNSATNSSATNASQNTTSTTSQQMTAAESGSSQGRRGRGRENTKTEDSEFSELYDAFSDSLPHSTWASMPDHILLEVFSFLPLASLFVVSGVCRRWYSIIDNPALYLHLDLAPYVKQLRPEDYYLILTKSRFQHIMSLSLARAVELPPEFALLIPKLFPQLHSLDVTFVPRILPYLTEMVVKMPCLSRLETMGCDPHHSHVTTNIADVYSMLRENLLVHSTYPSRPSSKDEANDGERYFAHTPAYLFNANSHSIRTNSKINANTNPDHLKYRRDLGLGDDVVCGNVGALSLPPVRASIGTFGISSPGQSLYHGYCGAYSHHPSVKQGAALRNGFDVKVGRFIDINNPRGVDGCGRGVGVHRLLIKKSRSDGGVDVVLDSSNTGVVKSLSGLVPPALLLWAKRYNTQLWLLKKGLFIVNNMYQRNRLRDTSSGGIGSVGNKDRYSFIDRDNATGSGPTNSNSNVVTNVSSTSRNVSNTPHNPHLPVSPDSHNSNNNSHNSSSPFPLVSLYEAYKYTHFSHPLTASADSAQYSRTSPSRSPHSVCSAMSSEWMELDLQRPFVDLTTTPLQVLPPISRQLVSSPSPSRHTHHSLPLIAKRSCGIHLGMAWSEYCSSVGRNMYTGLSCLVDSSHSHSHHSQSASETQPSTEDEVFLAEEDDVFQDLPPPTRVHRAMCSYAHSNSSRSVCRGHIRGVQIWGDVGEAGLLAAINQSHRNHLNYIDGKVLNKDAFDNFINTSRLVTPSVTQSANPNPADSSSTRERGRPNSLTGSSLTGSNNHFLNPISRVVLDMRLTQSSGVLLSTSSINQLFKKHPPSLSSPSSASLSSPSSPSHTMPIDLLRLLLRSQKSISRLVSLQKHRSRSHNALLREQTNLFLSARNPVRNPQEASKPSNLLDVLCNDHSDVYTVAQQVLTSIDLANSLHSHPPSSSPSDPNMTMLTVATIVGRLLHDKDMQTQVHHTYAHSSSNSRANSPQTPLSQTPSLSSPRRKGHVVNSLNAYLHGVQSSHSLLNLDVPHAWWLGLVSLLTRSVTEARSHASLGSDSILDTIATVLHILPSFHSQYHRLLLPPRSLSNHSTLTNSSSPLRNVKSRVVKGRDAQSRVARGRDIPTTSHRVVCENSFNRAVFKRNYISKPRAEGNRHLSEALLSLSHLQTLYSNILSATPSPAHSPSALAAQSLSHLFRPLQEYYHSTLPYFNPSSTSTTSTDKSPSPSPSPSPLLLLHQESRAPSSLLADRYNSTASVCGLTGVDYNYNQCQHQHHCSCPRHRVLSPLEEKLRHDIDLQRQRIAAHRSRNHISVNEGLFGIDEDWLPNSEESRLVDPSQSEEDANLVAERSASEAIKRSLHEVPYHCFNAPIALAYVCVGHRQELTVDPRVFQCGTCNKHFFTTSRKRRTPPGGTLLENLMLNNNICKTCYYFLKYKSLWSFGDFNPYLSAGGKLMQYVSTLPPPYAAQLVAVIPMNINLVSVVTQLVQSSNASRTLGVADNRSSGNGGDEEGEGEGGQRGGWLNHISRLLSSFRHRHRRQQYFPLLNQEGVAENDLEDDDGPDSVAYFGDSLLVEMSTFTNTPPTTTTTNADSNVDELELFFRQLKQDVELSDNSPEDNENNSASLPPTPSSAELTVLSPSDSVGDIGRSLKMDDVSPIDFSCLASYGYPVSHSTSSLPSASAHDVQTNPPSTSDSSDNLSDSPVNSVSSLTTSPLNTPLSEEAHVDPPMPSVSLPSLLYSQSLNQSTQTLTHVLKQTTDHSLFHQISYNTDTNSLLVYTCGNPHTSYNTFVHFLTSKMPLETLPLLIFPILFACLYLYLVVSAFTRVDSLPTVVHISPSELISNNDQTQLLIIIFIVLFVAYILLICLWRLCNCGAHLAKLMRYILPVYLCATIGLCASIPVFVFLLDWNVTIDYISYLFLCLAAAGSTAVCFIGVPHIIVQRVFVVLITTFLATSISLSTYILPLIFVVTIFLIDCIDMAISPTIHRFPLIHRKFNFTPSFAFPITHSYTGTGNPLPESNVYLRMAEFMWYVLLCGVSVYQSGHMCILTILIIMSMFVLCAFLLPYLGVTVKPTIGVIFVTCVALAFDQVMNSFHTNMMAPYTNVIDLFGK